MTSVVVCVAQSRILKSIRHLRKEPITEVKIRYYLPDFSRDVPDISLIFPDFFPREKTGEFEGKIRCYHEQDEGKSSWFKKQNSKKGFKKNLNKHACCAEGVYVVSDSTARLYLKLARQTQTNQSSSML